MSSYEDHIKWLDRQEEASVCFSETGKVTVEARNAEGQKNAVMDDSFKIAVANLRKCFEDMREGKSDE